MAFWGKKKIQLNNSLCDLIIHPDISGYSVGSFTREAADTLIIRGANAAIMHREQIRELKKKYNLEPQEKSRDLVMPPKWEITDLKFTGANKLNEVFLQKTFNLELPGSYSYEEIKNAIDRLYGYGGFDKIYFYFSDNEKGKTLNINIITKKEFSQNIGFKVNTIDAAALLLNATIKNYGKTFGLLSVSSELSANPGISILAETNKMNLPVVGTEIKAKYQKYDIFEKGDKISKTEIFYSSATLYLYQSFLKKYKFGLGIQEEYFNGDALTKNASSSVLASKINNLQTNAYVYFSMDNLDNFYFPGKGTNLYAEFSMNTKMGNFSEISPILLFKMKNVIPLWHRTDLLFNIYSRVIFNPDYPVTKTTLIGGDTYSQYFNYHFPFIGLPPVVIANRYVHIGLLGLRYHLSNTQFLSILVNTLQQGNNLTDWKESNAIYGAGIKYSLKTVVGPIDVGIGYSNLNKKPTFSANLGYWF